MLTFALVCFFFVCADGIPNYTLPPFGVFNAECVKAQGGLCKIPQAQQLLACPLKGKFGVLIPWLAAAMVEGIPRETSAWVGCSPIETSLDSFFAQSQAGRPWQPWWPCAVCERVQFTLCLYEGWTGAVHPPSHF